VPPIMPTQRRGWTTRFERANHRAEQRARCLWVSVWRRPDLDTATGAALAQALVDDLLAAIGERSALRTIVLDLRQAPPVSGPATQASLGRLLAACERAGVRVVALHGGEALAALQFGRLVRESAPRCGQVVRDVEQAEALVAAP
jgi:hypothetical protein